MKFETVKKVDLLIMVMVVLFLLPGLSGMASIVPGNLQSL